jgi:FKBP-type peptidyl-prolyl cis-trans isomerase
MCVGEQRELTIQPAYGYGENGAPPDIPGNAVLVFDTELESIRRT